jgi:2-polyprenyl-6-methoxyphenol hydroxylase-like FAD-dependent oxidoreductase
MKRIGIVGSGIGGLHLGLHLLGNGIPVTLYSDRTAAQQRARRLSNVVCRSAPTRERERQLGVNHWDGAAPDLTCMSVSVVGPRPLAFCGALTPPAQVVDMRIYWATLLEDFTSRGGELQVGTLSASDVDAVSAAHSLTVVAAGRGSLSNLFPRVPEHSPHAEPQRLVVAGLFRGIRLPDRVGFDACVSRGNGEILAFPLFSFEPDVTGLGIEIVRDGAFAPLGRLRYEDDPRAFDSSVLELLREHAPGIHARIDETIFGIARPLDVGHAAITPTVRRGHVRLAAGRMVLALGDAHIVMDPITGQGANKASRDAFVLGEAIRDADAFDEAFCEQVERRVCEYALPTSDACNARLQPPAPHVGRLLGAAAQHPALADLYASGFHHPDRFWRIISNPDRTGALLDGFEATGPSALVPYVMEMNGQAGAST